MKIKANKSEVVVGLFVAIILIVTGIDWAFNCMQNNNLSLPSLPSLSSIGSVFKTDEPIEQYEPVEQDEQNEPVEQNNQSEQSEQNNYGELPNDLDAEYVKESVGDTTSKINRDTAPSCNANITTTDSPYKMVPGQYSKYQLLAGYNQNVKAMPIENNLADFNSGTPLSYCVIENDKCSKNTWIP